MSLLRVIVTVLIVVELFTASNIQSETISNKALKIAVLNTCYLTEQHIETLRQCGQVTMYDDTDTQEKAITRLKDIDVAIVDPFKFSYDQQLFDKISHLKLLVISSSGYNMVDIDSANKNGILVANAAGYCSDSMAEHVMGLMLAVIRKIPLGNRLQHENPFEVDADNDEHRIFFSYNLKGKTLGLIGLGHSGKRVAELAQAFGMRVLAFNRSYKNIKDVTHVGLEELLISADVLSIHVPLSKSTEDLIGEKELALMKPSAIIINTARGKIINAQALYNALKNKKIAGAGLDVLDEYNQNNPLITLDNVILTPHSAFYSEESFSNIANILVSIVESFVQGNAINVVNLARD